MKHFRFTGLLLITALVIFLSSCGGEGNENPSGTDTTINADTTKTVEAPPAVNTIVTAHENMVVVKHKVTDFAKWLVAYEAHDSARLANGLHKYVIGRGFTDTNMVLVAMKADDMAKAKAFSKDPSLKTVMQKAGVTGAPTISFFVNEWQDTVTIPVRLRSQTTFSVKDWDTWIKVFQEGKQERLDNGITDRVVGHDADDNKKVSLVTAVSDTAKAFAYYKSDALKKRREASGVIGEPARFLFNIVKRY
ncbi:MAG: hypothetical protein QM791_21775 [Ferruginibacter sp.]